MHGSVPFGVASATEIAARDCRDSFGPEPPGNILPPDRWFMRIAHSLWPEKTAAWLRSFTGFPDRTCRSAASGDTDVSSAMLYVLARTDAGEAVLDKIMDGAPSDWWRKLQRDADYGRRVRAVRD